MRLPGADIICQCLQREGVEVVFGYPGGAILPTYDALTRYPSLHHVLTRHEQGASHMADGYARACGKVGVAMATSGPGATNLVTGIATAMMDSSPMVCLTGQVPTTALGGDAFQETDILGITMPITKHGYLVSRVEDLAATLHEAFHVARSGRPGPVVVDIPKDVQLALAEYDDSVPLPTPEPPSVSWTPDLTQGLEQALELLRSSQRPVILAGRGVLLSQASSEVIHLAERNQIPVALTLLGKGGFPEEHPLCLGMMGMHGHGATNQAIQEADLLLALGMRFDDRVTGNLATYAPNARKIHIDLDASEIGKNVAVDVGLVGDLKPILQSLLPAVDRQNRDDWLGQIGQWQENDDRRDILHQPADGHLYAAHVLHDLWQQTEGEALVVTDVGQHQMWEAQYYRHNRPHSLITSGGLGTMGFALPAALGAKMANPSAEVWAIAGDGGFQMTMAELATAVQERIEIKIAIINNGYLGMVRQWQELFYDQRYHATPMWAPDFTKMAQAFEIPAFRVRRRGEVAPVVELARQWTGGPVLVEFVVEQHDVVYPMVPAGGTLHEMIRRPQATAEMV